MVDLKVNIKGLEFKNPVMTASGTSGFAEELNEFYDVSVLGVSIGWIQSDLHKYLDWKINEGKGL